MNEIEFLDFGFDFKDLNERIVSYEIKKKGGQKEEWYIRTLMFDYKKYALLNPNCKYIDTDDNRGLYYLSQITKMPFEKKEAYGSLNIHKKGGKSVRNIADYIEYFLRNYDSNSYLLFIYGIISCRLLGKNMAEYTRDEFLDDVTRYFTDLELVKEIYKFSNDLCIFNVEKNNTNIRNEGMKYIQFTNKHVEIITRISIALKLAAPVILKYLSKRNISTNNKLRVPFTLVEEIYSFFKPIIKRYEELYEEETGEHFDLFNKIQAVSKYHFKDGKDGIDENPIISKSTEFGEDGDTLFESLTIKVIVDIIPKMDISVQMIGFLTRSVKTLIMNYIKRKPMGETLSDISYNSESDDELTEAEIIEASSTVLNEGKVEIDKWKIKNGLETLIKNTGYSKETLIEMKKFYTSNYKEYRLKHFQTKLIQRCFSKYLGGVDIQRSIHPKDYMYLIIVFKDIMEKNHYEFLQHILTGRFYHENESDSKTLNKKEKEMLEHIPTFHNILSNYFDEERIRVEIENDLNEILYNSFDIVDFGIWLNERKNINIQAKKKGKTIKTIMVEYLRFMNTGF